MSKFHHRQVSKRHCKTKLKTSNRLLKSEPLQKILSQESNNVLKFGSVESLSYDNSNDVHLFPIVNLLEKFNFKYEVSPDTHVKQNSFFMQDKFMNNFYKYYPEYLCFDVLCEIPEIDRNLVLLVSLDANGHCEIVSVGLIKSANLFGISWLCEVFKKHNPNWRKIEFITFGQNFEIREVFRKAFPGKLVLMSFFHAMKSFKKDLSNHDPVINVQDIQKALQIFEQMVFVSSETAYMELMKEIKQMPPDVYSVFKRNWHTKREFWVLGFYFNSKVFVKAFNSYLLELRHKIKPLVSIQDSMEHVIQKLHLALTKHRSEWFHKFTCLFHLPSVSYSKTHVVQKYSKCLTPYAVELIIEQLKYSENIRNIHKADQFSYKVAGSEAVVSYNACSCNFYTLMMLPCCHLFAIRNFLSLPLFFDSLEPSWFATNYQNTYLDLYGTYISDSKDPLEIAERCNRFRKCINMSNEMWHLLLDVPEDVSQERLEVLQNLLRAWKNNFKVGVYVSEKQNYSNNCEVLENLPTDYFTKIYGISLKDILDSENEFSSLSVSPESVNDL